jgi:colicin import membrane protein
MNRIEKKCLLASSGLHAFLLLVVAFGSAFFVAKEKPLNTSRLQFVPSRFVESALAGGGGNPNIARSDDVQKGSPTAPVPPPNARVTDKAPAQPIAPTPPPPKPEPKKPDPKVEVPKVDPAQAKKPTPKPVELTKPKPDDKTPQAKPRIDLSELKPVERSQADKRKDQAEAEAREAKRQTAAANAARQRLAKQIGDAAAAMQRGFAGGTKVEVGGPGGEAYADYASLVQAIYEDAWKILPDLDDNDAVALVRVTIARSGKVIESRIIRKSASATMDRSVQRALDRVKSEGLPPFPAFLKDDERTFEIEFNLKAKRLG